MIENTFFTQSSSSFVRMFFYMKGWMSLKVDHFRSKTRSLRLRQTGSQERTQYEDWKPRGCIRFAVPLLYTGALIQQKYKINSGIQNSVSPTEVFRIRITIIACVIWYPVLRLSFKPSVNITGTKSTWLSSFNPKRHYIFGAVISGTI